MRADLLFIGLLMVLALLGGWILSSTVREGEEASITVPGISLAVLQKELSSNSPPVLVDVRAELAYRAGHIPGALSVPLDKLMRDKTTQAQVLSLPGPVVIYCANRHCLESRKAAELLSRGGRSDIRIFHDGWQGWKQRVQP